MHYILSIHKLLIRTLLSSLNGVFTKLQNQQTMKVTVHETDTSREVVSHSELNCCCLTKIIKISVHVCQSYIASQRVAHILSKRTVVFQGTTTTIETSIGARDQRHR